MNVALWLCVAYLFAEEARRKDSVGSDQPRIMPGKNIYMYMPI